MSFENDLHDWYIDGIMLGPSDVTLFIHFYEACKKIRFTGATRCLFNDWLIQNCISEAKIISVAEEPELYRAEIVLLEAKYPARLSGATGKILTISASIGAVGIIEFQDFEVIDL
jgi:hypothetical protein